MMRKILLFFLSVHMFCVFAQGGQGGRGYAPVQMQLHGENLGNLIQKIAEIKDANILLPSGTDQIATVINFSTPNALPLEEIEEYLLHFLDMAGYKLSVQEDVLIVTKKSDATLHKTPMPLYINVDPKDLPDNPAPIRVMYFLKNLRVQIDGTLSKILHDILPENKSALIDQRSNCVIISGPSNAIAAAMTIVMELDNYGWRDEVAMIKLFHTSAATIGRLLEEVISAARDSNPPTGSANLYTGGSYFAPNVKVIAESRTNSIILLGKGPAINKIIEFVQNDLDLPPESGNCVVHVYNLKYLDAKKTAPVLQALVSGRTQSGQSIREAGSGASYHRFFDNARVIAEETATLQGAVGKEGAVQSRVTLGGNRLIIAATNDDYKEIETIIKRIDQPQHQVIIEVMILDLDVDKSGNYASQLRLPALINSLTNIGMQSVMQDNSQVIINDPSNGTTAVTDPSAITPQSTITADLFSPIAAAGSNAGGGGEGGAAPAPAAPSQSLADIVPRTGIIISLGEQFKNMGIAAILNFSDNIFARNIVATPSIVTQNNTKTEIKNVQIRRGEGQISGGESGKYGGATVVNIENYAASLGINLTPRINRSSIEAEGQKTTRLNLEVDVKIEEFKESSSDSYDKITRALNTSVNLSSGDLLVFGGLSKKSRTRSVDKTPILGDIPLLGTLFRRTTYEENTTDLVIIIRATAVEPLVSDFMQAYTQDQIHMVRQEIGESIFGKLKDPITRMYFGSAEEGALENSLWVSPLIPGEGEGQNKDEQLRALYSSAKNPFMQAAPAQ